MEPPHWLYARYALAGALCTSLSLTTADLLREQRRLQPNVYRELVYRLRAAPVGRGWLARSLVSSFGLYFLQGAVKFGGYEYLKIELLARSGGHQRNAVYLAASAVSSLLADLLLSPLEAGRRAWAAARTRSTPSTAGFAAACRRLYREQGVRGFYRGFWVSAVLKQAPYQCAKFLVYERAVDRLHRLAGRLHPDQHFWQSPPLVAVLDFAAGLQAGCVAALVSTPSHNVLVRMQHARSAHQRLSALDVARQLGIAGLVRGTVHRCLVTSLLTAGQFAFYGDIQRLLGATGFDS